MSVRPRPRRRLPAGPIRGRCGDHLLKATRWTVTAQSLVNARGTAGEAAGAPVRGIGAAMAARLGGAMGHVVVVESLAAEMAVVLETEMADAGMAVLEVKPVAGTARPAVVALAAMAGAATRIAEAPRAAARRVAANRDAVMAVGVMIGAAVAVRIEAAGGETSAAVVGDPRQRPSAPHGQSRSRPGKTLRATSACTITFVSAAA